MHAIILSNIFNCQGAELKENIFETGLIALGTDAGETLRHDAGDIFGTDSSNIFGTDSSNIFGTDASNMAETSRGSGSSINLWEEADQVTFFLLQLIDFYEASAFVLNAEVGDEGRGWSVLG